MKRCFRCGKWKPIEDFYRHPQMLDGHLGKCKDCTKKDNIENRRLKVNYYRDYDKKRFRNPRRRVQSFEQSKQHRLDNPEKYAARTAVGNALRDGRLLRKPCEVCGNPKSHAHHPDYSQPLYVIWLCKACHTAEHQSIQGVKAC